VKQLRRTGSNKEPIAISIRQIIKVSFGHPVR